jgi:hypothetical protein
VTTARDGEARLPDNRLVKRIARVLRHASVPRPVWHLAPRDRWCLLRDTLLGHAPIRGGLRPRDLPFDAYCRSAIATAARVHCLPAYRVRSSEPGLIRFIDWLVVYSSLIEARSDGDSGARDAIARDAVYDCIDELRRAVRYDLPGVPLAECPFVHRMLGLLGMSQQEWERSDKRPGTAECWMNRDDARLAVIIGSAGHGRSALPRLSGEEQAALPRVIEARFRLFTVRTTDVQGYLARGKRHWLMRGASAWCSQSLSLARDLLLMDDGMEASSPPGAGILLSDSDAIFSIVASASLTVEAVADRLEKRLRAFWGDRAGGTPESDRRFPRFAEYRRIAIDEGVDPAGVMPVIKIQGSRPLTAVDLCTGRFSQFKSPDEVSVTFQRAVPNAPACSFVTDDSRITLKSPPWLRDEDRRSPRPVGWTGIVWSLCGTTFRTHCHEGLSARLRGVHLRIVPVNHGDWLKTLTLSDEPMIYVKIDGDAIGARFRRTRIPRLPGLGLALADTVSRRLMAAVEAVCRTSDQSEQPMCLPLDIVYLGGDDLLCCVPRSVLPTVLDAFGRPLAGDRKWRNVTFTFAAIELPARGKLGSRTDLTDLAAAATRAVGPALTFAKSLTKAEHAAIPVNEASLRRLLGEAGAAVGTVGDMETHGCIRGVRIVIRPAGGPLGHAAGPIGRSERPEAAADESQDEQGNHDGHGLRNPGGKE